jgi:hypothetical protein
MTDTPLRPTYEGIQQEAKGPGVKEWKRADKLRADLTNLYNSLRADTRYTEEYKAERAWSEYEKVKPQIEQLAPESREELLRGAEGVERGSIPTPEAEGLITRDTAKLLLTQGERSRIEGLINRAKDVAGSSGFQEKPVSILSREYERGLSEGGPSGGATVRAVYGIARDWGLEIDAIVDKHRKPYHREALETAQRRRMWANMVGRSVPQPPFQSGGSSPRDVGTYSSRDPKAFIPKDRPMQFETGRPYWK